ncbi:adventurous gliding motility lipoprotein CglC [Vulgatibacter sp.]|uniref:adventurous gliding motility lipoprotein CglC n=1 Tax=Vulgatibacter sp. TaxID=1971226 RepID=UPI003565B110
MGLFALACSLGFFLTAGSCVETDVGAPCNLAQNATYVGKNDPNCPSKEEANVEEHRSCFEFSPSREDLAAGGDKEYVSFGAAECDNLTCVRSKGEPVPETDEAPNGTCSGECITDQDCSSEDGKFVCRELFLDQAFLTQLRENLTEEEYARYFGRIQNTKFCARAE